RHAASRLSGNARHRSGQGQARSPPRLLQPAHGDSHRNQSPPPTESVRSRWNARGADGAHDGRWQTRAILRRSATAMTGILTAIFLLAGLCRAAVPTPKDHLGYAPGADFKLADYHDIISYFQKLASSSDRILLSEF